MDADDSNNTNYSFNIPATARLTNDRAHEAAADAPAIEADQTRKVQDVTNCMRETKRRKLLKLSPPPLTTVTSDEVSASFVRQVAVASEVAAAKYSSSVGTPQWATALIARFDGFEARLDGFEARFDGFDARFDGLEARLDGFEARFDGVDARLENSEARRANAAIVTDNDALRPLYKIRAGHGAPLPGVAANTQVPNAKVGAVYPNFPNTFNDLNGMTNAQISYLAQWANETFGIVDGDTIDVRRNKFRRFIC